MSRLTIVSLLLPLFATACADAPPAPSIEVNCNRSTDPSPAVVILADGTTVTCSHDGDVIGAEPIGEDGSGGTDGGVGAGGAGGEGAELPDEVFFCYGYAAYPAGVPCDPMGSGAECPIAGSPCEIPKCQGGFCSIGWLPEGSKVCADLDLHCVGSLCCGFGGSPF